MTTHHLQVFDPPMCCATGVCGPEPDPALARFGSDLKWAESHGVRVERFSLSREPEAFVRTPAVADAFRRLSVAALPLVLVDGQVVSAGAYPARAAVAARLGLVAEDAPAGRLRIVADSGCVPDSGCCGSGEAMTSGLLEHPTRYLFFTGKGGVGKTSLSSATAVALADGGRRVLLVSTDPASNLEDVFGVPFTGQPTPIPGVANLSAIDIDPEAAARDVRERTVGPFRGTLPDDVIRRMEEELSGACSTEVAAFDEFIRLLVAGSEADGYDHVIFDTAPTGHTLRLLALPAAWDGFLRDNTTGASCLGPLAALGEKRALYAQAVATLRDPGRTSLILVTRPESSSIAEAERTRGELADLGIAGLRLLVNGELVSPDPADPLAAAYAASGQEALAAMPEALRDLPTDRMPLRSFEALGVDALRAFIKPIEGAPAVPDASASPRLPLGAPELSTLVDELAAKGRGLVLVMGKGGVGKTTLAAAIAVELARRGHAVKLSTTDPAAHLETTLAGSVAGLEVERIDPREETRRYVEHVLATTGASLDAGARALLEEDLRSPCTEEIAVFSAFSHLLREARRQFVVLDTAPTGHTLLLLDATGAYHRDVMRKASASTGRLKTPLDLLRDPEYTHVMLVASPQSTPVAEAERLQEDLRRAGIEPWAWVLNRSLAAAAVRDLVLGRLAEAELRHIARVRDQLAPRMAIVPWQVQAPVGAERLRALVRSDRCAPAAEGTRHSA